MVKTSLYFTLIFNFPYVNFKTLQHLSPKHIGTENQSKTTVFQNFSKMHTIDKKARLFDFAAYTRYRGEDRKNRAIKKARRTLQAFF